VARGPLHLRVWRDIVPGRRATKAAVS
jgi:hypothetical protein